MLLLLHQKDTILHGIIHDPKGQLHRPLLPTKVLDL